MKVKIEVFLKEVVLDPQGKTIRQALQSLGYDKVTNVRAGKVFLLTLDAASPEEARAVARRAADQLLANPVIEDAVVTLSA